MRSAKLCSVMLLLLAVLAPPLSAQMSAEGTVTYLPVTTEVSQLPDGTVLQYTHQKGLVVATNPDVPLHMNAQDCVGANVMTPEGMLVRGHGSCFGVDAAGDVWWVWYNQLPDGGTWGFLGGTGKFEGIEGDGTTQSYPPTADGRLHVTWQGTWQMR